MSAGIRIKIRLLFWRRHDEWMTVYFREGPSHALNYPQIAVTRSHLGLEFLPQFIVVMTDRLSSNNFWKKKVYYSRVVLLNEKLLFVIHLPWHHHHNQFYFILNHIRSFPTYNRENAFRRLLLQHTRISWQDPKIFHCKPNMWNVTPPHVFLCALLNTSSEWISYYKLCKQKVYPQNVFLCVLIDQSSEWILLCKLNM